MDASPAHLHREETLEEVARPGNAELFGQAASRGDPAPAGSLLRAAIQPSLPWFSSQSGMPHRSLGDLSPVDRNNVVRRIATRGRVRSCRDRTNGTQPGVLPPVHYRSLR